MKPQFVAPFDSKAATLRYDALYMDLANSPTWRTIFGQVCGADFPEEVMPLRYVTVTALQRIAHELAVVPGGTSWTSAVAAARAFGWREKPARCSWASICPGTICDGRSHCDTLR